MQIIVYTNDDGGVSILTPSPDCGLSIEEIAQKDIPLLRGNTREYLIINDSELPDRQYRDQWRISNGAVIIDNLALPVRFPNWDNLYARLLLGDLKPILLNLKQIAKTDNAIAIDFMSLTTVLSSIRAEQALQDCLIELITDGYVLSDEHRTLWNNAIAELNFSDLVKL